MLRSNTSLLMLAMCAATLPDGMATCAAADLSADNKAPEWIMLMPVGAVPTNDGRSYTNPNPQLAITSSKLPGLIDFDHGTQLTKNSKAAGWVTELKLGGPNGELGIWGQVEWTPAGKEAIASKLYRFFSPTFLHDKANVVTKFVGGSLVNNPALDVIPALASTNQETTLTLEELLAKLRKALGLGDNATVDECIAAIAALNQNATATASQVSLLATASGIALTAGARLSDDQVATMSAKLKAPAGDQTQQIATLSGQVADLTTRLNVALLSRDAKSADDIVEQGMKDGKIAPGAKAEMLALCQKDQPGFIAMLAKMPAIIDGRVIAPAEPGKEGEPDGDALAVCSMLGVNPASFQKTRAAETAAQKVSV